MAITILQTPHTLEPVYSPFWIIANSDQVLQRNMQYVYDLYILSSTTRIARVKYFPLPDATLTSRFSPHAILQNYLSFKLDIFGTGWTSNMESVVTYKVNVGEEYDYNLTFTSTTNYLGYVQYDFNSAHGLLPTDYIRIDKSNKGFNSSYDGIHQVLSALTPTQIITDTPFGISTPNESGYSIYRLTFSASTGASFSGTAINFAREYEKPFATYDYDDHYNSTTSASGGTQYLLPYETRNNVAIPKIRIKPNDSYILGIFSNIVHVAKVNIGVYNGNSVYGIWEISNPYSGLTSYDIKCGPANLKVSGFTGGTQITHLAGSSTNIFDDNVTEYFVTCSTLIAQVGTGQQFIIDRECSRYPLYRLCWLNSKGRASCFDFERKSIIKSDMVKQSMTKLFDWNYDIGKRGETILSNDNSEYITLNTTFVTEFEVGILKDLFNSIEVYMVDEVNDKLIPVTIVDKAFNTETYLNEQLLQYTVTIKYAYDRYPMQRN